MFFIKRFTSVPMIYTAALCMIFILPFGLYTIYRAHQSQLKILNTVENDFKGYLEWRLKKKQREMKALLKTETANLAKKISANMQETLASSSSIITEAVCKDLTEKEKLLSEMHSEAVTLLNSSTGSEMYHFLMERNGRFILNEQQLFPGRHAASKAERDKADKIVARLIETEANHTEPIQFTWNIPLSGNGPPQEKIIIGGNIGEAGLIAGTAIEVQNHIEYISESHKALRQKINHKVIFIAFILSLLLLFLILAGYIITLKLHREFSVFRNFFNKSNSLNALIETDKLSFSEFREIASIANEMLESRQRQRRIISVYMQKLKESNHTLRMMADRDGLTGVANRRFFDKTIEKSWYHALRHQTPITLGMIDIDFFKQYNDTYGHQKGDQCLITFARTIEKSMRRPLDLVARYGGEEFVTIFPDTDEKGGMDIAYRIHESVSGLNIHHETSVAERLTFSMGLATLIPSNEVTPQILVLMADSALYKAKQQGRNQIVVYRENMEIISTS